MPVDRAWYLLENQIAEWMRSRANGGLVFRNGNQAIPGYPSDGFRADALLTDGRTLVAVEVEVKQTHPDTNVGKYWLLAEHQRYERVVLLHVFTPGYNSYPWRKSLAEFYAKRMTQELPFEYVQVDARHRDDPELVLAECVSALNGMLERAFNSVSAEAS